MQNQRNKLLLALFVFALAAAGGSYWYKKNREERSPVPHDLKAGEVSFKNQSFDVIRVRPDDGQLRLFWKNENGQRFGSFAQLKTYLEARGEKLIFATNAGIFSKNYSPGGLHIENGELLKSLNTREGEGNFHLMPNGVFFLGAEGANVVETSQYVSDKDSVYLATQSGPMLVIDGEIHPAFNKGSSNKYIRNGVGVASNGDIFFAISNGTVNFYDFAMFFRNKLDCQNALYLDGSISDFYLPQVGRTSTGGDFCGIIALVEPAAPQSAESMP